MSNHQTEADPAVIALLIEKKAPHLAENMTYVAGDRVVTDPLCKPFSIGRGLIFKEPWIAIAAADDVNIYQ
ncbi:hypothetical protein HN51_067048 [Arachis hypogaea]